MMYRETHRPAKLDDPSFPAFLSSELLLVEKNLQSQNRHLEIRLRHRVRPEPKVLVRLLAHALDEELPKSLRVFVRDWSVTGEAEQNAVFRIMPCGEIPSRKNMVRLVGGPDTAPLTGVSIAEPDVL